MTKKIVKESLDEYLAGEEQEGQRFREPDQVDYPLAEEEEEVEEGVNSAAMPSGNFIKPHADYYKKDE